MAANVLRLRRSLALSSAILNHSRHFSVLPSVAAPSSPPYTVQQNPCLFNVTQLKPNGVSFQFISSRSISSRTRYNNNDMDGDQISEDAILFEGCDYNHWLITMDFPKDPKPSPEEMVETYVQTAAKVLGSVEEAKKKIYACSTTTYNGFQVEVSEEVSEQFKSIPGVVFVLPDSYIDPVNKEYGGDKYINGTIIPRPPPVQAGRYNGRYNRPPPRGQYEPSGRQGNYQRGPVTSNQSNYNQGENRNFPPRDQGNYARSGRQDFRGQDGNFTAPPGGGYNQGGGGGGYRQGPGGQYGGGGGGGSGGYGQGSGGPYGQMGGGNYGQGTGGQYGQGGGGGGNYGQGGGGGNYGQGAGGGNYRQSGGGGNYGQGTGGQYGQQTGYGGNQTSPQYGENAGFSQAGQSGNRQQGNYEVVEEAEAFKER